MFTQREKYITVGSIHTEQRVGVWWIACAIIPELKKEKNTDKEKILVVTLMTQMVHCNADIPKNAFQNH